MSPKSPTLQTQPPVPVSGPSTPLGEQNVERDDELYLAEWEYEGDDLYEVWRGRSELAISETVDNPDHDPKGALARAVKDVEGVEYESVVPPVLPGRTIWPGEPDHPFGEPSEAEVRVKHDAKRAEEFHAAGQKAKSQRDFYAAVAPPMPKASKDNE